MRCVVQRVHRRVVVVEGRIVVEIGRGLVAMIGVANGDAQPTSTLTASKLEVFAYSKTSRGR